jgi:hypothetical protein
MATKRRKEAQKGEAGVGNHEIHERHEKGQGLRQKYGGRKIFT